jgi:ligand-binding sensor domain-containing protein/signal transduction histidine kinase
LKRRIHIILLWLALTVPLPLLATDLPFTVDSWTTEDGLPQSSVISMAQTQDGYLWLGTLNGLARFDGNSFTRFNVNNMRGLSSDRIVFLFKDSRDILWVGTDNAGLCAIQNGTVTNFDITSAGGNIVYAYEDETGGVWFCTATGRIYHWKDGQLDSIIPVSPEMQDLRKNLLRRAYHVVVPGAAGEFWQLETNHVEKWGNGQLEKDFGAFPWPSEPVSAAFSDSFDANVTAACEDGEGNLIVGTRGDGIYWFDTAGGYRRISAAEGLSKKNVSSLYVDRDDNLWVGTDGGGLYRVKKNYFVTPAQLSSGVIKSVAEDGRGGLWVEDNARGVVYFLTNSLQEYKFGAWSVLVDNQQQVWAGTRGQGLKPGQGLFRFAAGYFRPVAGTAELGTEIYALFESHEGQLWVGGQNGLGCFDGQNWKFFTKADGLPPAAVRAITESTNGDLWIGTEGGGLFLLSDGKISPTNAPAKDISCLLVDHSGVLWVGTSGHGLARFAQGHWTSFAASDGLAGDDIGYLIEDDLGYLWIGSYEGLTRVGEESLAAAADKDKKVSCRVFLSRECSAGAQPAATRAHDGKLWFPTIQGLVSVNPEDLKPDTNPPPVIIESVLVDGNSQKDNPLNSVWSEAVTLTPRNEQLEIHFTALDFSAPKRAQTAVRFKYQLEGRDKGFTDIGGERVAHFNKLPPGDYYFHVIACNEDGFWNNTGARLEIIVQPPFWRKPWFVAASILIFIGGLAGIIYLISTAKLKRELRALHQKELIERERARIARDLHDQLGANLTQVSLLGEMAEADKDLPAEVELHAQQICATARETTRSLDEIVWAVNPSNDTLEGLANYACKYAQDYFALANVSFHADLPASLPATPILPEVRHNVFLAFKEAVNNVVKHAQATRARVWLRLEPEQFILGVEDNGHGLGDVSEKKLRNGLKNMRKRLADVHGEFEIAPGAEGGTVVQLKVPITKMKS